jgi:hypothetical protein
LESEDISSREFVVGGALMLAIGVLLLAATYVIAGQLPAPHLLALYTGMAALGCLWLLIGVRRATHLANPPSAAMEEQQQATSAVEPSSIDTGLPMTQLQFDYWVLGLDPTAAFFEVRRAHRQQKAECIRQNSVEARQRLEELNDAYRRLRRLSYPHCEPAQPPIRQVTTSG